eukprot:jgi/Botrbrau1/11653/Bobra.168_2s0010.1
MIHRGHTVSACTAQKHCGVVTYRRPALSRITHVKTAAFQQNLAFRASSGVCSSSDECFLGTSLQAMPSLARSQRGNCSRFVPRMGNKGSGGPFAPLVVLVRNIMGKKEFNKFRGQAISLHSQVIKIFGANIGADSRQVQGLIKLAKKNGEKLGFLA